MLSSSRVLTCYRACMYKALSCPMCRKPMSGLRPDFQHPHVGPGLLLCLLWRPMGEGGCRVLLSVLPPYSQKRNDKVVSWFPKKTLGNHCHGQCRNTSLSELKEPGVFTDEFEKGRKPGPGHHNKKANRREEGRQHAMCNDWSLRSVAVSLSDLFKALHFFISQGTLQNTKLRAPTHVHMMHRCF